MLATETYCYYIVPPHIELKDSSSRPAAGGQATVSTTLSGHLRVQP